MCTKAQCSVSSILLSSVLMILSSPLLLFASLILLYVYRLQSFLLVSEWFHLLPDLFFLSAALNLLSGVTGPLTAILQCAGRARKASLLLFSSLLLTSCVSAAISAYGCTELQSIILQQKFLATNIGRMMEQYMTDQNFRVSWDSLQTQYQCCGTLNFNTGYAVWKNSYGRHNNSVPDSCCHQPAYNCGSHVFDGTIPPLHIHTHGCFTVIQSKLEQEVTLILTVTMVLQVVMMILTLVTLILSLCQASNDYR